jgi:PKD repeat protein
MTISTVNTAPIAKAGPDQSGQVGQVLTLDGSASSDNDGDSLSYQWSLTSQPPGSMVVLNAPTSVTPTLALDKPGTYVGQLIVNDGTVDSASDTVTISTFNSKPVADAGDDRHAVLGSTVTLSGTDSLDVDGDILSYQWSLVGKPATSTATLTTPTEVSSSFVIDRPGSYTLQLTVSDGSLSSIDTVTVTTQNVKPVADAGDDQEQLVGQTVQLDGGESSDDDGDRLTYAWSFTARPDTSMATLSSTTAVNPTFVPDLPGTYVVQLIVNDEQLESDPDTAIVTITVPPDITPPAPADLNKVTTGPVNTGQVTVTGTAGSVEGGAQVKITNTRTGQMITVTAGTNGSFSAQVNAQAGDMFSIVVIDAAGNTSTTMTTVVGGRAVGGPPPTLAITSPVQGALIAANRTRVTGTVQGSVNTGVVVNGIAALVYNSTFVADNIPLVAGQNTLTVVATSLGTQSTEAQVTVTSDGDPIVLEVQASPTSGIAPLPVTFTYQFGSTIPIQSLSLDFDGNGTVDFTTTDANALLRYTYTVPGLYVARLQITDQQGQSYNVDVSILVQDGIALDTIFKGMWGEMNASLLNGDIATALLFLDAPAQEKFEPVWRILLPRLPEIIASYSPIQGIFIGQEAAEYGLTRVIDGETRLFFLSLVKNRDGVWRLAEM